MVTHSPSRKLAKREKDRKRSRKRQRRQTGLLLAVRLAPSRHNQCTEFHVCVCRQAEDNKHRHKHRGKHNRTAHWTGLMGECTSTSQKAAADDFQQFKQVATSLDGKRQQFAKSESNDLRRMTSDTEQSAGRPAALIPRGRRMGKKVKCLCEWATLS